MGRAVGDGAGVGGQARVGSGVLRFVERCRALVCKDAVRVAEEES